MCSNPVSMYLRFCTPHTCTVAILEQNREHIGTLSTDFHEKIPPLYQNRPVQGGNFFSPDSLR